MHASKIIAIICRYITTYYSRWEIDFGCFKRDVLLFKTISLAQLFAIYFYTCYADSFATVDWISLSMIVSGYSVSLLATKALGIDRTYFGAELGKCAPLRVAAFPYG